MNKDAKQRKVGWLNKGGFGNVTFFQPTGASLLKAEEITGRGHQQLGFLMQIGLVSRVHSLQMTVHSLQCG